MNPLRSVGARLALGVFLVVTGALGIVYLILVPSLEDRLVNSKLAQVKRAAAGVRPPDGLDNPAVAANFVEEQAKLLSLRAVVFDVGRGPSRVTLRAFADSASVSSPELNGDPVALRTAETLTRQTGTVERDGERFAESAVPVASNGVVLLSSSLRDSLGTVELVERRILVGGLIALLAALLVGYGAAWAFARRIRRLERAANRIASGRFDEPVVDQGSDELAHLASAFDRMRSRLAQLDRARSEFIANASHELRTPLFSLSGFLELLAEEELDADTRREFLDTMREQTARLTRLATDLLDLSRIDAGRMSIDRERVDLGEVARGIAREFQAVSRTDGREVEILEVGEAAALADEQRVVQIARVLVENALVHTPSGTPVRLRATTADGRAVLEVQDEGPGVPPEQAEHLFERFYRGDGGVASGSGLGLAIARELAELMGGSVELVSGGGRTTFALKLPAAEPFPRENRQLVPPEKRSR